MMKPKQYDLIAIGAGSGGLAVAEILEGDKRGSERPVTANA